MLTKPEKLESTSPVKETEKIYVGLHSNAKKSYYGIKLKNISDQVYFDIDQIVRQAAYKAIFEKSSIFLSGKEALSKYLLKLSFGFEGNG